MRVSVFRWAAKWQAAFIPIQPPAMPPPMNSAATSQLTKPDAA